MVKKITKATLLKREKRLAKRLFREKLELVKEEVKQRDGYKCQLCGSDLKDSKHSQCHHILPKCKHYELYLCDANNLILLCFSCHKMSPKAVHHNSFYFTNWLKKNRPEQFDYLYKIIEGEI